jgi:hypothetical protein
MPYHRGLTRIGLSKPYQLPPDWLKDDALRRAEVAEACRLLLIDLETNVGRPLSVRIKRRRTIHA